MVKQRKAANSSHLVPTPALRLGDFDPPSDDGIFPTASRDKSVSDTLLRSEDQHQTQEQRQEQHQEPHPVPAGTNGSALPQIPVHSPAQPMEEIPPVPHKHKWPPLRTCVANTVCLRQGCGVTYDDYRYLREIECYGEEEEAANA